MGAVLEGARNIYWQLSPWQNLLYFGRLKGVRSKQLTHQAESLLRTLDLWHEKDEPASELSRGNQQKVAIACALIHDPPILLLDEPTLGLDVKASRSIKKWIGELATHYHKTIVLTTHQLDIAEKICDRIVIMNKGRLIADKPTQELLKTIREEHYHIAVAGKIDPAIIALPGMHCIEKDDHTIFVGAVVDHHELYKSLEILHAHKLPLISVTRSKHNLEDVFMHLTHREESPIPDTGEEHI
jgi:ABC-2 type transport system ATP-binding protein